MISTFPKSGKRGKAPGYRGYKKGIQVSTKETEFHGMQGTLAKSEDAERADQYGKPGTSAKARQADPYETSMPTSRYRSRRP